MTVGSPTKLIIQFMIPMCLGNVFQQFYNIADSIIAGQFWVSMLWQRSEVPVH